MYDAIVVGARSPTAMSLAALHGNQTETNRFLGVWAGTVPIPEFFAPENILRYYRWTMRGRGEDQDAWKNRTGKSQESALKR